MSVKNVTTTETKNQVKLELHIEKDVFEAAVQKVYRKNVKTITIPGFRKGKAPRSIIEKMYGKGVFYEDALNDLLPAELTKAVEEAKLEVVSRPEIEVDDINDDGVTVFALYYVKPEVELKAYKGLEAEKKAVEVTDEDVDNELKNVAKRNARKVSVERAAELGDVANIDFDGYLDGERFDGGKAEGYDLELGSNSFVPGFEEQIVGMNIGEEKDLDITFPENYTPELAGKAVVFKVKLNSLTAAELPELDDEFAKDVSEFDTIEEYKADLRANLLKNRTAAANNEFRTEIIKQAVNNVTADIPDCMITEKMEETLRGYASQFGLNDPSIPMEQLISMFGLTEEALTNNIRPAAEFQVRTDLLLNALIETEELGDDDDAFAAYVEKVAGDVNATVEQLREYFGENYMRAEFKKELATNLIVDSAVVKAAE